MSKDQAPPSRDMQDKDEEPAAVSRPPLPDDRQQSSFLQYIRLLFLDVRSDHFLSNNGDGSEKQKQLQRRKRLAVSFLAVVMAAYLRYAKRHRGSRTSASSSPILLWPLTFLVSWWKGPEYKRSPQESTMSLLWNAARDGLIQQALIGSSTIFFQTKSDGSSTTLRWNRAVLPPNNESIKTGLLEAIATGGCSDIQALPESIWSRLATPIVAALPFVYLALLYGMMRNQFGGEDITSRLTNGTRKLLGGNDGDDATGRTTFADVAGLDSVVEDVKELVEYLDNPSVYEGLGARPPRGVLLYGPPGSR
jgi:hypothetical protein